MIFYWHNFISILNDNYVNLNNKRNSRVILRVKLRVSRVLYDWNGDFLSGYGIRTELLLVSGVVTHVFPLEEHVNFSKRGPGRLLSVPALGH